MTGKRIDIDTVKLEKIRDTYVLSNSEFATDVLNISVPTFRKILKDKKATPRIIRHIAQGLGLNPVDLVNMSKYEETNK